MQRKIIGMGVLALCLTTVLQAKVLINNENFALWSGIVVLASVALAILYFSSQHANKMQLMHQLLMDKQIEMEKNQNILLTTMSENIHSIAKQALEEGRQLTHTSKTSLEETEENFSNVENRLLDVTNDLIDFLRLKSQKVEIVEEEFNINNVLNEVSGNICSKFAGSSTELIFDIDKNIPRNLIGDSLHLGQILESILEYQMDQANLSEVKLEISLFETYDENIEMQFKVTDTG